MSAAASIFRNKSKIFSLFRFLKLKEEKTSKIWAIFFLLFVNHLTFQHYQKALFVSNHLLTQLSFYLMYMTMFFLFFFWQESNHQYRQTKRIYDLFIFIFHHLIIYLIYDWFKIISLSLTLNISRLEMYIWKCKFFKRKAQDFWVNEFDATNIVYFYYFFFTYNPI